MPYPFSSLGIPVDQPFGQFIITVLPAGVLLDTAFSDRLTATRGTDGRYHLSGSQRRLAEPRLKDIGKFIETGAASFPNTIILAANYREEDGLEEEEENLRWRFSAGDDGPPGELVIPEALKRAAIIDGQHRLFGFNYVDNQQRLQMPLVCAVFFDLPKPYQARLFATINANQRPVSKSQTYELFGYNVEEEPPRKWTPEKLAVFMARKLNTDHDSPLREHIVVPAENTFSASLYAARVAGSWAISMATIVDGILRLISTNPKRDGYEMDGELSYEGRERSVIGPAIDPRRTPLREVYRQYNDEIIYTALLNYFSAVDRTLWQEAAPGSFIRKTVGVQALFDISRSILYEGIESRDLRVANFSERLLPAQRVDFSDHFFHASGASRTAIRKTLEYAMGWRRPSPDEQHFQEYTRLIGN